MDEVNAYIAKLESPQKVEAERIRSIVAQAFPGTTQAMSYGMPGFKYKGKYLITYNAFKDHYSLFPGSGPIHELAAEVKNFETSKGTIKYTQDNLISAELVGKLVARAAELIDERVKK